ncbi:MAG: succinylglutamate desuccinylase [Alphaproteobacteria bacterium]|nr:succinylglutamate desuccinylase [Alphaproteobacteria bacterium]
MPRPSFEFGGELVKPGSRASLSLALPNLSTYTPMSMPVHIVHGRKDGPVLFISAAVHGDEINGVEIIRRLLKSAALKSLRGTLIAVPIVNVYGFVTHSRYLPDRRDLNRSFPGSEHGSLTARLAYTFTEEILDRADFGIDLHTGGLHRFNHPHIRANLEDPDTDRLAHVFGTPVIINANLRDGSLRQMAAEKEIPILLYEAGEALRFDQLAIQAGVRGIRNVMRAIGMLPERTRTAKRKKVETVEAKGSSWVRAPQAGLFRAIASIGARVVKDDKIGAVADAFGDNETFISAPATGIVIGRAHLPVVNEGDALYHIARFEESTPVADAIESFTSDHLEGLGPADYGSIEAI